MMEAYCRLHDLGFAHSFETYYEGELVGGLYGVSLGQFFFGESMFHTMTDASKVAFVRLVEFCRDNHFLLIDAQQETPHLASLGAKPIPRQEFLKLLDTIDLDKTLRGKWG
jgi:leucyl/phenylalanyl-tRNA--protein transferase